LRDKLLGYVGHSARQSLVLLARLWIQLLEVLACFLVELGQHLNQLLIMPLSFLSQLLRNCTTSNCESVVSLELLRLANQSVHDQAIKALKEGGAQVLVQEVDISQAKYLLAIRIVPTAETIQIHTFTKALSDVSQKSTHEGEVISVYWDESGDVVLVLIVEIGLILLVDESS